MVSKIGDQLLSSLIVLDRCTVEHLEFCGRFCTSLTASRGESRRAESKDCTEFPRAESSDSEGFSCGIKI